MSKAAEWAARAALRRHTAQSDLEPRVQTVVKAKWERGEALTYCVIEKDGVPVLQISGGGGFYFEASATDALRVGRFLTEMFG